MTENCRKSCQKCTQTRAQICGGGAQNKGKFLKIMVYFKERLTVTTPLPSQNPVTGRAGNPNNIGTNAQTCNFGKLFFYNFLI